MRKQWGGVAMATVVVLSGCAWGRSFIDQVQPEALAIAQRRAAFEVNCPAATTQVLSRETLNPAHFKAHLEARYLG